MGVRKRRKAKLVADLVRSVYARDEIRRVLFQYNYKTLARQRKHLIKGLK